MDSRGDLMRLRVIYGAVLAAIEGTMGGIVETPLPTLDRPSVVVVHPSK